MGALFSGDPGARGRLVAARLVPVAPAMTKEKDFVLAGTPCLIVRSDKETGTIFVNVIVVTPWGPTTWEVSFLPSQLTGK